MTLGRLEIAVTKWPRTRPSEHKHRIYVLVISRSFGVEHTFECSVIEPALSSITVAITPLTQSPRRLLELELISVAQNTTREKEEKIWAQTRQDDLKS